MPAAIAFEHINLSAFFLLLSLHALLCHIVMSVCHFCRYASSKNVLYQPLLHAPAVALTALEPLPKGRHAVVKVTAELLTLI